MGEAQSGVKEDKKSNGLWARECGNKGIVEQSKTILLLFARARSKHYNSFFY
jgi:hypothetical protein